MIDMEKIKAEVVECLKPVGIEKIILFGSYACGKQHEDSDIDLYVVTKDDFMPRNYKEKSEVYLKVARLLRGIRNIVPIDLIVHTKQMYEKFLKLNSMFSKSIIQDGVKWYES